LIQQIFLSFNSPVIYAAGEPVEPTKAYRAELRAPEDLSTLRARVRSYAILSRIPAVDDATLAAAPGWGQERPLPDGYEQHLALPETVTPRTRTLAADLTAGLETPFAKAQAIERYLRTIEYDLNVPLPPDDVTDVADYFLFDLQRGYCDYYATTFVVMARSVGLPTRFATGFAVGQWNAQEQVYVVTEAEAHSWPEVYFPDYGWIPFEPTGGRPPLERETAPITSAGAGGAPMEDEAEALAAFEDFNRPAIEWNWQMLFWLPPLGLLIWGGAWLAFRWRRRREDPWLALVGWGARQGRPMGEEETALEYGRALGQHIEVHVSRPSDSSRMAAREVVALSDDVTRARYGPTPARLSAAEQAAARWARLRGYLRRLRLVKLRIED
jgi:transglutaminase-like putative cysteine protease